MFDIIDMENSELLRLDIYNCITRLDFLITKIKNPEILSPKETLLNNINLRISELSVKESTINNMNLKIHELSTKIDNMGRNIFNNNNPVIPIENIKYSSSPRVVIPTLGILEDSIHNNNKNINNNIINNNGFQEVKSKKKNHKNKDKNNNKSTIINSLNK
jgi:hypothetical protein